MVNMTRITRLTVLFASGLLVASTSLLAQESPAPATPATPNWFEGQATLMLLGRDNVDSSKFQEYREVPKGVSMPVFTLQGSQASKDFAIFGSNVSRSDQRYSGYASIPWVGVTFDYNQIPHNMGNNGRTFFAETADGVWSMSPTLRASLGAAVDAVPTAARTYPFYVNLLDPTIASAGFVDISALRQHGDVTVDLGKNLPFDLAFTYLRDVKSGSRAASGGDILSVVTTAVDVLEPLNEVTQDFGLRWAYNFKAGDAVKGGNVYATFNRNDYNDRIDSLIIDNPFRATDRAYVSTSVPGGPGQVRFSTAPDNEANREAFGAMFKFKRQTRITADLAFNQWTQNAAFLPFTINTAIIAPTGIPATDLSLLPRPSLDGKIDTTLFNFGFVSRPIDNLAVRLRYRAYDLTNKTTPISWTTGDTSGAPDRSWTVEPASADAPYGYVNANLYDNSTKRFDAQVGYDIKDFTLEAAFRNGKAEHTHREAASVDDNGYSLAAVYNSTDWLAFRVHYDWLHRTPKDFETIYGLQADEAEKKTNRVGLEVDLTPSDKYDVTVAYFRRHDDYPNRPDRIAVSGGVPVAGAQPIPGTPSGLLEAGYDTYTLEFGYLPNPRAELRAYYSYEKNAQTNQWSTTTGVNLNNLLNYAGSDKGNTFGVNGVFHVVPDKWIVTVMVQHQNIDGLMDITAREQGSFYTPGRTTLVPPGAGGALDINDFDDTEWTTAVADLAYTLGKAWMFSAGYAYDKYTHADAFSDGTTIFPQSVLFFLKANDGGYTANIGYTRLTYRF